MNFYIAGENSPELHQDGDGGKSLNIFILLAFFFI